MAILKHLLIILPALVLTGCFEEFEPDVASEPVLCVNSVITAGETFTVEVSHTWRVDDPSQKENNSVPDAEISVYVNGGLKDSDYIAREGDHIRIEVVSATYGRAEAEVTVPYASPIASLEYTPTPNFTSVSDDGGYNIFTYIGFNLRAKMRIDDPADTDNYYLFDYDTFCAEDDNLPDWIHWSHAQINSGNFDAEAEPIFSEHIGMSESIMGFDVADFTFFTDRQFPGKSYTLSLRFRDACFSADEVFRPEDIPDGGFIFSLYTLSESYYNWLNYMWQLLGGPLGDFSDIGFCAPVSGYSNVSTGAGVVAACSRASVRINLQDFLRQQLEASESGVQR